MRANARSADGDPASTPTNLEISPPAVDMPASSLALSSGAVSSSWMSKRLMSVFTVIAVDPVTRYRRGNPGSVFTLLLASYLPSVSYSAGTAVLRSQPAAFNPDYVGGACCGSTGLDADIVPPSRRPPSALPASRIPNDPEQTGGRDGRYRRRANRDTGRRDEDRAGPRRPLHQALVHRRARPAEELFDQLRRAGRCVRGGDGVR